MGTNIARIQSQIVICVEFEMNLYRGQFSSKGCQYVTTNIVYFDVSSIKNTQVSKTFMPIKEI